MAERSKALASGASREICVGSNPTLIIIFLSFLVAVGIVFCSTVWWCVETTREWGRQIKLGVIPPPSHLGTSVYGLVDSAISVPTIRCDEYQARAGSATQARTGRWTWLGSCTPHALAAHASSAMLSTVADKNTSLAFCIDLSVYAIAILNVACSQSGSVDCSRVA